ncbi:hypothetical protein ACLQ8T_06075 [Glutamicibacter sp. FR1]|uniref:hypothetical protein n=1 Tax=Glutamicibacter sp. FR1 TaxID=3393744 RepID=UPI0039AF1306
MRLYKMQITNYPAEAFGKPYKDPESGETFSDFDPSWKPVGWKEWVDEVAELGYVWARRCREEGYPFFWPSEKRTYQTKQAAESKAWAVRRWGGQAIVLEAEVGEFVEVETAKRNRQQAKDLEKAEKLRAKAQMLKQEAEELERSAKQPDWDF